MVYKCRWKGIKVVGGEGEGARRGPHDNRDP